MTYPNGAGSEPTRARLALYFLRLGALGFGGPVALANTMRRDLAEKRRWLTEAEYEDGLAIAAACPGPLAYQLAVYCGYVRHGLSGGLAVAAAFALAPFVLVVTAACGYVRFSGAWQLRALFFGVAPVVMALILKASVGLGQKTLRKDPPAWFIALLACGITVVVQKELAAIFLAAGALGAFIFAPPPSETESRRDHDGPAGPPGPGAALFALAGAAGAMTSKLFLFFFKTGLLVFGSGLVIVPFLKTYLVDQYHWLSNREFLDAVAIGMISPGPVVVTATFVGYLLGGFPGALAATLGIFSPAVLFTVVATPLLLRTRRHPRLKGFIRGITVAVVGVLVGTTWLVGRTAIVDAFGAVVGVASLALLFLFPKLPEPVLVLLGALAGLAAYPLFGPA